MARSIVKLCEEDIDYSSDNIILFTWNPDDKVVGSEVESKWDNMVCKHLKHLTRVSRKFCVVAELSPTGRLHCHGWFSLDDKYKWNKSVDKHFRVNGNLRVSKMRSTKAFWYYKKEIEKTLEDTSLPYIVFCHRNRKSLLAEIKQKYINREMAMEKKLRSKSILDYAAFSRFQDDMDCDDIM